MSISFIMKMITLSIGFDAKPYKLKNIITFNFKCAKGAHLTCA